MSASANPTPRRSRFPAWLRWFEPAPPAALPVTGAEEVARQYRSWQRRVLLSTIVGYAMFYFVRKNLSIAMPAMGRDLGLTKADLGLFLTLHGLLYGVSKFANGFLGDRCHARTFMVTGLALSALVNVWFGLGSAALTLGLLWLLNGWVQGMGFPPCARLMTHWFPPREFATRFAVWNTSHSIGAALVVVLCGYLIAHFGNWRLCFFVPAGLALLCAVYLLVALPDTPPSVGLPEAEGTAMRGSGQAGFSAALLKQVFANPYIWLVSLANFFVYVVRYGVFDWGPTLLTEMKGIRIEHAGWMVFAFEGSGVAGMLLSGWLTDRFFGGRGARVSVFFMLLAGLSLLLFWKLPGPSTALGTLALCLAGFFIYGPQALVGIIVAKLATKHLAATAVGLTGIFGYASTVASGWGFGKLVHTYGWDAGLAALTGTTLVAVVLFALAWNAQADGYGTGTERAPRPSTAHLTGR
jgi:OPA family glycerol-3-phosphate transporter-like MFS transporter/OPA family sugar phosphate sensor protein UhpC-like MFS transporter